MIYELQKISRTVIEVTRLLFFFFHMFFSKKETNPNPTFNKPIKEFITLNDQLSTKNFPQSERFIIN